jgi:hypothetical protein
MMSLRGMANMDIEIATGIKTRMIRPMESYRKGCEAVIRKRETQSIDIHGSICTLSLIWCSQTFQGLSSADIAHQEKVKSI